MSTKQETQVFGPENAPGKDVVEQIGDVLEEENKEDIEKVEEELN